MGYSIEKKKLLSKGPIALVSREEVIKIVNQYLNNHKINSTEKEISHIFIEEHKVFLNDIFSYTKILNGVRELLIELNKKKIKCAIITGVTIQNTEKILAHLNIDSYFQLIIGK